MNKCILLFLLIGVTVGGSALATAQEKDGNFSVAQLDEIVVTAPIIDGNEVNRYGSQVTIVTEEQIESLNAQDVPGALRRTPGVVISRHNPVGSFGGGEGGSIFIRGQGSSRPGAEIQLLVDGAPKFVGVWTHPLMDVLSIDNVERIEVYKGAQPVLFGNMAFGAVNLYTKRIKEDGFTTSVKTAYGSFDTVVEVLDHGGKINNFDYYLVQSYRQSDGHRDNADGELQNYFGRMGYEFSPHWDATVTVNYTDNWADDPGRRNSPLPPDGRFNTEDYFSVATISHEYSWVKGYFKGYYDGGGIDWEDQEGTPGLDTCTDYDNYGIRARESIRPWTGGEIMVGLDWDFISGKVDFRDPENPATADFPRETFRILAPYTVISQSIAWGDNGYLIPSAGLRYFDHNQFDEEIAPQIGLVLGWGNTELHGFYSRGINYPGVYVRVQDDIFLPEDNKWKDLEPEKVDHFEAGISHRFLSPQVDMDCTWFYDDGEDRIVVSPPPPFPPLLSNIDTWKTRGVEGTVTYWPARYLSLFAGFTYLDASPSDLPYTPEWTISSGLNCRFQERWNLSVDSQFVDKQFVTSRARQEGTENTDKVSSYYLFNAKVTYDMPLSGSDWGCQMFVAGENLTNKHYEQKIGYPMPGVSGMAGVKLSF